MFTRSLHDDRFKKTTQKRLHSCVLAQPKGAQILEKLGDNAGKALKIVIPAAYPTAGLKTSAKTIIHNTILNYLGNIRWIKVPQHKATRLQIETHPRVSDVNVSIKSCQRPTAS